MKTLTSLFMALTVFTGFAFGADPRKPSFQYKSEGIEVPAASADERQVKAFGPDTVKAAAKYLDDGAHYWVREKSCLACHSTGVYMVERSALTKQLGKPSEEVLKNFIASVPKTPGKGGKATRRRRCGAAPASPRGISTSRASSANTRNGRCVTL